MGQKQAPEKTLPIYAEKWFVGFFPANGLHWYEWIVDPDFAHVCCWRWDDITQSWLFVDWSHNRLNLLHCSPEDLSNFLDHHNPIVLDVNLPLSTNKRYFPSWPMYCVSFAKHCLGIKGWHIVTPKQLYRHLLSKGASVSIEA